MEFADLKRTSDVKIKQLTEKVVANSAKEAQMKENNDRLLTTVHELQYEISEKNRVNSELQKSTAKQTAEQDKAKEELQGKISAIQNILQTISPASPSPEAQRVLLSLQKTRDRLRDNSPLELAKAMVEKLITLSTRPEIHQMAQYEYEQYEGKVAFYMQELQVSIDKLNDKSSMTTPPLPSQFPSFSDRFMNEYWMEIDKSRDQKEDNECLICFFEMTHEMDTLKCEECKKVLHMECASKWLKIHRSCPHCRREQLDPNEFPALQ